MFIPTAVQVSIVETATPQQLPNLPLNNKFNPATLAAASGNAADLTFGNTAALATTGGGGGVLAKGDLVSIFLTNANQLFVSGTAGDTFSIFGSSL